MLSTKAIIATLAVLLTIISATQSYAPRAHPKSFTIAVQRYRDPGCHEPFGKWRWGKTDQRFAIKEPKKKDGVGRCWSFDDPFGSYDFKWTPRIHYEADTAQDDPQLGKHGRAKHCSIRVYGEYHCMGEAINTLTDANKWDNIERCHGNFTSAAKSMRMECETEN